jgi:hypothetical protein
MGSDKMKQSDVLREAARVLDMCGGDEVTAATCVTFTGRYPFSWMAQGWFGTPTLYKFALGLVEGRGVFEGDTLYALGIARKITGISPNVRDAFAVEGFDSLLYHSPATTLTWTKPDPYAELKAAQKAGKVIQLPSGDKWEDLTDPTFDFPVSCYRIKPEPEINRTVILLDGILLPVTYTRTAGKITAVEIVK